jgi:predicted Zn-dependent peptidase
MSALRSASWVLASLALAACGGAEANVTTAPVPSASVAPPAPTASAEPPDPLGPRPVATTAPPFQPPAPTVYQTANGMTVWLLERHALPIVAATVIVPSGSASEDRAHAGLASMTAGMLDEGAGKLGAIDFAKAVDQLGAHLRTGASRDTSSASVSVTKHGFAQAMGLLGDAVVRPRFDPKEWKRVHDLWTNDLKERASDPGEVAHVVQLAALFGVDHPYGHPTDGLLASAPKVTLDEAKRFYAQAWRPDRAFVVVVGDVTRAELDPQLDAAFGAWKKPATPPPAVVTPPAPPAGAAQVAPRVVLVDRPDAPQSMIAWLRTGPSANDASLPPLERANVALGGSFTSRLMQDLREAHGWTYGARSRVDGLRGPGVVAASAAVITDKTADALKAMLADIDEFAKNGLTDDEAQKTRTTARNDLVESYQTVEHTAMRLARDAALGLGPDFEAKASVARDTADRGDLNKVAAAFFERSPGAGSVVVIVGPRAKLEGPLSSIGLTSIEMRDAEGNLVVDEKAPPAGQASATKAAPPAKKPKGGK